MGNRVRLMGVLISDFSWCAGHKEQGRPYLVALDKQQDISLFRQFCTKYFFLSPCWNCLHHTVVKEMYKGDLKFLWWKL
jgi:hypothetical protein